MNITITLDAETMARVIRGAVGENVSVEDYAGELVMRYLGTAKPDPIACAEATRQFLSRSLRGGSDGKPYPKREELYDRKCLR